MEKLLDLVKKLRESVTPPTEVGKMSKKEIIAFVEDAKILEKMQIFHEKRQAKALKSIVHEADEESLVPDLAAIKKWSVGKLRKLLREFYRDIGLSKGTKHSKMSASKLRSFVSRNRYQEMLYGDDDMSFLVEDEKPKKAGAKPKKEKVEPKAPKEKAEPKTSIVNVYTAKESKEKKECECDMPNILEEQDAQGVIMNLAPELYRSLLAKSYLLDLCNLNRMRREHEVCAVACDPKSYNRWACCEKPCCPEDKTGVGKGLGGYGVAGDAVTGLGAGGGSGTIGGVDDPFRRGGEPGFGPGFGPGPGPPGPGGGRGRRPDPGPGPGPPGPGGGRGRRPDPGPGPGPRRPDRPDRPDDTPDRPRRPVRRPGGPTPGGPTGKTVTPRTYAHEHPIPSKNVDLVTRISKLQDRWAKIQPLDRVSVNPANVNRDVVANFDREKDRITELIRNLVRNMSTNSVQNSNDVIDRIQQHIDVYNREVSTVTNSQFDRIRHSNPNSLQVQNWTFARELNQERHSALDNAIQNTTNVDNKVDRLQIQNQEVNHQRHRIDQLNMRLLQLQISQEPTDRTRAMIAQAQTKLDQAMSTAWNMVATDPVADMRAEISQINQELGHISNQAARSAITPIQSTNLRNMLQKRQRDLEARLQRYGAEAYNHRERLDQDIATIRQQMLDNPDLHMLRVDLNRAMEERLQHRHREVDQNSRNISDQVQRTNDQNVLRELEAQHVKNELLKLQMSLQHIKDTAQGVLTPQLRAEVLQIARAYTDKQRILVELGNAEEPTLEDLTNLRTGVTSGTEVFEHLRGERAERAGSAPRDMTTVPEVPTPLPLSTPAATVATATATLAQPDIDIGLKEFHATPVHMERPKPVRTRETSAPPDRPAPLKIKMPDGTTSTVDPRSIKRLDGTPAQKGDIIMNDGKGSLFATPAPTATATAARAPAATVTSTPKPRVAARARPRARAPARRRPTPSAGAATVKTSTGTSWNDKKGYRIRIAGQTFVRTASGWRGVWETLPTDIEPQIRAVLTAMIHTGKMPQLGSYDRKDAYWRVGDQIIPLRAGDDILPKVAGASALEEALRVARVAEMRRDGVWKSVPTIQEVRGKDAFLTFNKKAYPNPDVQWSADQQREADAIHGHQIHRRQEDGTRYYTTAGRKVEMPPPVDLTASNVRAEPMRARAASPPRGAPPTGARVIAGISGPASVGTRMGETTGRARPARVAAQPPPLIPTGPGHVLGAAPLATTGELAVRADAPARVKRFVAAARHGETDIAPAPTAPATTPTLPPKYIPLVEQVRQSQPPPANSPVMAKWLEAMRLAWRHARNNERKLQITESALAAQRQINAQIKAIYDAGLTGTTPEQLNLIQTLQMQVGTLETTISEARRTSRNMVKSVNEQLASMQKMAGVKKDGTSSFAAKSEAASLTAGMKRPVIGKATTPAAKAAHLRAAKSVSTRSLKRKLLAHTRVTGEAPALGVPAPGVPAKRPKVNVPELGSAVIRGGLAGVVEAIPTVQEPRWLINIAGQTEYVTRDQFLLSTEVMQALNKDFEAKISATTTPAEAEKVYAEHAALMKPLFSRGAGPPVATPIPAVVPELVRDFGLTQMSASGGSEKIPEATARQEAMAIPLEDPELIKAYIAARMAGFEPQHIQEAIERKRARIFAELTKATYPRASFPPVAPKPVPTPPVPSAPPAKPKTPTAGTVETAGKKEEPVDPKAPPPRAPEVADPQAELIRRQADDKRRMDQLLKEEEAMLEAIPEETVTEAQPAPPERGLAQFIQEEMATLAALPELEEPAAPEYVPDAPVVGLAAPVRPTTVRSYPVAGTGDFVPRARPTKTRMYSWPQPDPKTEEAAEEAVLDQRLAAMQSEKDRVQAELDAIIPQVPEEKPEEAEVDVPTAPPPEKPPAEPSAPAGIVVEIPPKETAVDIVDPKETALDLQRQFDAYQAQLLKSIDAALARPSAVRGRSSGAESGWVTAGYAPERMPHDPTLTWAPVSHDPESERARKMLKRAVREESPAREAAETKAVTADEAQHAKARKKAAGEKMNAAARLKASQERLVRILTRPGGAKPVASEPAVLTEYANTDAAAGWLAERKARVTGAPAPPVPTVEPVVGQPEPKRAALPPAPKHIWAEPTTIVGGKAVKGAEAVKEAETAVVAEGAAEIVSGAAPQPPEVEKTAAAAEVDQILATELAAGVERSEADQQVHDDAVHSVTEAAKDTHYKFVAAKRQRDDLAAALPPEGTQLSEDLARVAAKRAKLDKNINDFLASDLGSSINTILTEDDKADVEATLDRDIRYDTEKEAEWSRAGAQRAERLIRDEPLAPGTMEAIRGISAADARVAEEERRMAELKRKREETEAQRAAHAKEVDVGHKALKRARVDARTSGQTALLKAWQAKSPLDSGAEKVPSALTSSDVLTDLAKSRGSLRKSAKFSEAGRSFDAQNTAFDKWLKSTREPNVLRSTITAYRALTEQTPGTETGKTTLRRISKRIVEMQRRVDGFATGSIQTTEATSQKRERPATGERAMEEITAPRAPKKKKIKKGGGLGGSRPKRQPKRKYRKKPTSAPSVSRYFV